MFWLRLTRGNQMTFLDLFSGIGGFRLAMEQAGHVYVGHCEIDKYANESYIAQLRDLLEDKRKKIDPLTYSLKTLKIYLALTEGSILRGSSWSWTKSGMMQSGHFSTLPMSSLKTEKESSLSDILEDEVPEKYFLSEQTVKRLISYKDNVLMRLQPERAKMRQSDATHLLKVNSMKKA